MALTAATAAHAQPAPNNIDDRLRQQVLPPGEAERTEAMMTGDTDLVLLRTTPLFTAHADISASHTSNAFLSPDSRVSDTLFQGSVGLRIGTTIAGKVDVFADLGVVGVRYADNTGLGYNAVVGALGLATRVAPLNLSFSYQPSIVYDGTFSNRQLTQHRLRAEAALPFQLAGAQILPAVSVERSISSPSDYSSWAYGAQLTASRPLSRRTPLFAIASVGYERREYDSYFFDFLGVKRRDDTVHAGVTLLWRPRPWADLRATYDFAHNRSTSDVNGYTAHTGTLGVGGSVRF